jgi:hypothetical protein
MARMYIDITIAVVRFAKWQEKKKMQNIMLKGKDVQLSETEIIIRNGIELEVQYGDVISAKIEVDGIVSIWDCEDWRTSLFDIKSSRWDFDSTGASWPTPKLYHDLNIQSNFED